MDSYSLVEVYGQQTEYKCGYCKSSDTNHSYGMWAHFLTCKDYENLLNRGWRRSGKYLYKPTNHLTCCPAYTISCHALDFKLSKSQKKVLKRFNHYLMGNKEEGGDKSTAKSDNHPHSSDSHAGSGENITSSIPLNFQSTKEIFPQDITMTNVSSETKEGEEEGVTTPDGNINAKIAKGGKNTSPVKSCKSDDKNAVLAADSLDDEKKTSMDTTTTTTSTQNTNEPLNPATGSDGKEPVVHVRVRKAKEIRLERKKQKLIKKGIDPSTVSLKKQPSVENMPKELEAFLVPNTDAKRNFVVKTVSVNSPEFQETFEEEYQLFRVYQMTIHQDEESDCTRKKFKRFLCDSPLNDQAVGNEIVLGSFHQQYYCDDEMIAVGVIDILPHCVSSVYFFYSPNYMFLSLGTFGALKEIATVREWNTQCSSIKYYYMGFYIHNIVKMRYKGNFTPSYLLCPEIYTWHLLDDSLRNKLTTTKYSRLNPDATMKLADVDYKLMPVLFEGHRIPFMTYQRLNKKAGRQEPELQKYANLVGPDCIRSIIAYLESLKISTDSTHSDSD